MIEMIPGIYQLQIPIPNNPLGNTNCYLVQGDNEFLLIDPGVNNEEAFDALEKGLSEINITFEDIAQILVTHSHGDHYGLVSRVKQLSQARLLLHHIAGDAIQSMAANTEERLQRMGQWLSLNGMPSSDPSEMEKVAPRMPKPDPITPDVVLYGGETIVVGSFKFQVVWTPGHAPGHICLYEPDQKILFSGDHVLFTITPHISMQPQSDTNPLGDFFNSLNTVGQLDVNLVLPAHERTFTNLQARIEEIIEHHEERNAEILAALKTEPKTGYEISTEITWMRDMGGVRFQKLDPWDKRMAVSEVLAHLNAMELDGRVAKSSRDSIIYYQHT